MQGNDAMSATLITCPQCGTPVDAQERYCVNCRVHLAFAAALAEERLLIDGKLPDGTRVTPDILVPRLGDYLVEKGYITHKQLEKALVYQAKRASSGRNIVLGQALRELQLVSPAILDEAVTVQILELQSALRRSNRDLEVRVQERTRELEQAIEKLKELSQLKANFIANISHELRTPLTHIKGYLELLLEKQLGDLTEAQKQAIDIMVRSEERLERLIEDLIQFSLVSKGKLSLYRSKVDLGEIVWIVYNQARQKARAANIELLVEIAPDLPQVECDEEKIGWVITQLTDNALKFTPALGRVQLRVGHGNGNVTVAVIDSGIGIPQERLVEIFEPFHQLEGTSTRRYSGTGLGLTLSMRILAAHGSDIRVHSRPGFGSSFEFELPIVKRAEGEPEYVR